MKCMRCSHEDEVDCDPSTNILMCSECGARMSFGVLMPRVVVSHEPPFIKIRLNDATYQLDPQFAAAIAKNLL